MAVWRRPYLFADYQPGQISDPVLWTMEQRRRLVALHVRWGVTGDLLRPEEVRRLEWWAWMVTEGKVRRG